MNTTPPRPIRLLPPTLRNQIAAGEVVERPASVLKELLENSLDAGADNISVTLEDGGQSLLAVRDNGYGIPASDLELAVTRHATNKLANFQDLLNVTSYGFRGEALPSIASVAELRLESAYCPAGSPCEDGAFLLVKHGDIVNSGPSSINKGTLISVTGIFANVPARLKFLKTPATELKRCQEALLRLALARPDVGVSLTVGAGGNQREIFRFPAGLPLRERLAQLWPPQITEGLIAFSGERGGLKAHGLASLPQAAQTKGDRMLLYVNGRPVNDRLLLKAVREAYKGRLTSREYPQIILFVEIDPQEVDVNVHPAKTEVRFRDERMVFGAVLRILESGLSGFTPIQEWDASAAEERALRMPHNGEELSDNRSTALQTEFPPLYAGIRPQDGGCLLEGDREPRPKGFWGSLDTPRLVDLPSKQNVFEDDPYITDADDLPPASGALERHKGYAFPQSVTLPDMEASTIAEQTMPFPAPGENPQLRESASFSSRTEQFPEAFRDEHRRKETAHPSIAAGYPVTVGPLVCLGQIANSYLIVQEKDELLLLDQHAAHERVLLHLLEKESGSAQSQLLAIPAKLSLHPAESERLMESMPSLASIGFDLGTEPGKVVVRGVPPLLGRFQGLEMLRHILTDRTNGIDDMLHLMACHSAIKAGQKLTADEAAGLLLRWMDTPDREFCPHGRPIIVRFGKKELEKLFKRTVG